MKFFNKKTVSFLIAALFVLQAAVMLAGCTTAIDNEKTPLVLSSEALDGVFNPFSYTAGADGEVIGPTQLGMLNIDKNGEVVAGKNQPTVALDYSFSTTGTQADYDRDGNYDNYYTDYYFAIKDGIKFSDGVPLTIKDVLFNMYVYLDPVYTGSSTMYSIDIKGLSAYRTQSEKSDSEANLNRTARINANKRIDNLISWCADKGTSLEDYFTDKEKLETAKADIAKAEELFREELNTDWAAAITNIEEYEKYYLRSSTTEAILTGSAWAEYTKKGNSNKHISEAWEVFLIMYGEISTNIKRLDDGTKRYTFEYNGSDNYDHSKEALINRVFGNFMNSDNSNYKDKLLSVITQYQTSNTLMEYLVAKEKEKLLKANGDELLFPSISGITTYQASSIPGMESVGMKNFDKAHDILKIRINGVDPKAIYSFSFSVAPMHYYSTKAAMDKFLPAADTEEDGQLIKNYTGFGVEYGSTDFMQSINTNLVPRGAGPYRPTNGKPEGSADNAAITKSEFFSNMTIVNYERNNYFNTVMENGNNAKIKFLRYKIISSNAMVEAVTGRTKEVYISMPNATSDNNTAVRDLKGVKAVLAPNMGYGYIGINAAFVKDIEVRRAIMHAMDVELCRSYYGSNELVDIIYRPMSINNWAYPSDVDKAYYQYDKTGEISRQLVEDAGYRLDSQSGILTKDGEKLKFTFTVAGETEDHPAYQTMTKAAEILNKIGFDITVTKDTQALSKLATGQLQIWAAAWGSSIDPDMYQVYHKESGASSVKNWGYPYLLRDGTFVEQDIIDRLSEQIELGRKFTSRDDRKPYYADALNLVMDLAVELPTYQRKNMFLVNTDVVDINTLLESNVYQSPISELWNISFVQ